MTLEEKYDKWERFARLVYRRSIEDSRKSRKEWKRLLALYEEQQKKSEASLQQLKDKLSDRTESS